MEIPMAVVQYAQTMRQLHPVFMVQFNELMIFIKVVEMARKLYSIACHYYTCQNK
jgi:hypothetical protein